MCEYFSILFTIKKAKIGKEKNFFLWTTLGLGTRKETRNNEWIQWPHVQNKFNGCFLKEKNKLFPLFFMFAVLTNQFGNTEQHMSHLKWVTLGCSSPFMNEYIKGLYVCPLHFIHNSTYLLCIKNFLPILWKVRAIIQKRCSLYSQWIRSYSYMSKVSSFNSHLWTLKNMNGSIIIRSIKKSEKLVCNSIL